ncbi:Transcriptional regulator [Collimonas arenae]|uniref:Transcriptional regulator n=1 Tax=Collimonas arenae TaxID=279058 RepID=A0A0A1FI48_9BURK|nr:AraC family transcriptional regulator [Collimonas arenae]AIY43380.1 Transcriptional regulator [Collimonas arenae]
MNTLASGFVSSAYVRVLFEYLKIRGIDASALLGLAEPEPVDHMLSRYPMQRWVSFLQTAAAHLEDPLLGLKLGQTVRAAHFGVLGYIFASCLNRGLALLRLQTYERLLLDVDGYPMQTLVDGSHLILRWSGESSHDHGRLNHEFGLAAMCNISREISDGPPLAKEVCFVNSEPPDTRPYTDFFGCDVLFNQPATTLRILIEDLNCPLRRPDPRLIYILEKQAEGFLAQLPKESEFVMHVRRCIANLIHSGEPGLEQVASVLSITPRTLRRRLHEYGTTFRELLDDIRRHMAEQYLRDPNLQLADVAQLLGYSEQSAFQRAFQRWTGTTPKTFQEKT